MESMQWYSLREKGFNRPVRVFKKNSLCNKKNEEETTLQ